MIHIYEHDGVAACGAFDVESVSARDFVRYPRLERCPQCDVALGRAKGAQGYPLHVDPCPARERTTRAWCGRPHGHDMAQGHASWVAIGSRRVLDVQWDIGDKSLPPPTDCVRSAADPQLDEAWHMVIVDILDGVRDDVVVWTDDALDPPRKYTASDLRYRCMATRDKYAMEARERFAIDLRDAVTRALTTGTLFPRDSFESAKLTAGEFNEP